MEKANGTTAGKPGRIGDAFWVHAQGALAARGIKSREVKIVGENGTCFLVASPTGDTVRIARAGVEVREDS
jgi:hypothetical protein